jgi:putative ABC transport system permease protein
MGPVVQDVRYTMRAWRTSPLFTLVAVGTLALGIGANSAIFTLFDAALLRPLPFPEPHRLVLVWEDTSMFGLKDSPASFANYLEWRAQNHVFEQIGALEQKSFRLTGAGAAQQIQGSIVTASLFEALSVPPALGRAFRDDEDQPGTPRTLILSDGLWERAFGRDPAIVGRTIDVNDEKYLVVGVMPPGFRFPDSSNELWAPVGTVYAPRDFTDKGRHNSMVVARLRRGIGLEQANNEMHAIAARLQQQFPRTNSNVGTFVAPLRDHFVAGIRPMLIMLAGAVGFLLLVTCANIANLLLSRGASRRREIAIRTALGASRRQVVGQLLTESLLLAGAGGLSGVALAWFGVSLLARLLPTGIAAMASLTVDTRVLAFTTAASLITGLGFGLVPALEMLRVDVQHTLKEAGAKQGTPRSARGLRDALVVSEVALACVLAIGAALFIQSFAQARGIDPGFRTENILTLKTPLSSKAYRDPARRAAFYAHVLERVSSLPGVVSAGFTNAVPLVVKGWVNGFTIEGRSMPAGTITNANYRIVTEGYLRTIGIPLREGRYLDSRDTPDSAPVVLINEAMKRKFWPNEDAIGKRLRFGPSWVTIVGVVGDIRQSGLEQEPRPEVYLSSNHDPTPLSGLAIRTRVDPTRLAPAVRREIQMVDNNIPIVDVRSMDEVLDREVFQRRAQMVLLSIFTAIALLLASIGIYGVLAYLVAQRTREIGIRMALGAAPRDVILTVAGRGVALSMAGVALGITAALALSRVVSSLLFGVSPSDPRTFVAVAALLLGVAAVASYVPARLAMRIDPMLALRGD